ncbi:YhgE/Pip domain-containing protein [Anoxybacillus sp. LAT_35]|uniref:YhgE/Pip domain-containing protein n=1 Tax=Anoxybacillus TaxID=150247 RepID=UPI001EDACCB3|nr:MULTISPECIES: YhgE/Pip domain-containing protein [Anoxybacillus]MCG5025244.1 YhgE/Pip domain-containing protein [Anoxybacillus flavithermus]MCG6199094.1 YhgE/Pip domain-containing protein [Anoxybacillus sp. LAT_38]MCG3085060.1 YhgE/Pip domain-containing protein [Anoxybacillus sp. LAT27]MCG6171810.1 YhgE/Pip domain-containing protein [Anoxybacillus sp. LAT_11]MCG6174937.1 YhgE/Pip domain-containing protein [Anoxybacillus sp. LAT_31]
MNKLVNILKRGLSKLFIKEIKAVTSNRKVLIPIIAVLFIPLLYSGMFLWAFWDPYDHLDDLPVAVVNNDKGATFEGEELHIGDDLVDKLKEKKQFDWHFVSQSEGEKGLKEQRYYMLIEIPEDFSKNATTLQDDHPKKLQLIYKPNEGFNFLSAQIGGTAVERIKTEVAKTLTETYAENMFENVKTLADGLTKASDGANKLHDGLIDAKDGTNRLYDGMTRIVDGQKQLLEGTKQAEEGTSELVSGARDLLEGMKALDARMPLLLQGSEQLSGGTEQLVTSLAEWQQGATQVQAGATQVTSGLEQLVAQLNTLIAQTSDPVQKAVYEQLKQHVEQLSLGSKQVETGVVQLNDGAKALQVGATSLSEGAKQLHEGHVALDSGVNELLAGQQQLVGGMNQLQDGAHRLADGAQQLANGMNELTNGTETLQDGMNQLADGSGELADKLKEGAEKASNVKANEDVYNMFAEPVKVKDKKINEVPNYGTGFTPYFLSLGLFVGALLLSIVFPLREPAGVPRSPFQWFFAKFGVLIGVGVLQALLADSVLLFGLDLQVKSVPLFLLFSVVTSITFLSVIQFLVTVFGDPGRFIGIVVLILQLTTSAGTFPLELIPRALQHFNAWLPMTYSVFGFKAVISSGDFAFMWENVGKLLMFIVVMMAGTMTYFTIQHRRQFTTIVEQASEA